MKRIFVQIASYRDPECQWTVKDLFEKAKYPDRVNVGICWQYDPEKDKECFRFPVRPEQVRITPFHWKESQGVCWARHQTQVLYEGEDYALFIDSHMRFAPDWDERMIAELARCPSPKAILSNHPAPYTPPCHLDANPLPTVMYVTPFSPEGEIRVRGKPLHRAPKEPLRGAFVAPGFMFAGGEIIEEVPYDPYLYFSQEELSMAARLFTHGWDVYSPTAVLIYHYYTPAQGVKPRPMHWEDNPGWRTLNDRASARLNHLLGYETSIDANVTQEMGKYGLGKARTLAAFETFSGIDIKKRKVSNRARQCGFIDNLSQYLEGADSGDKEENQAAGDISPPPSSSDINAEAIERLVHFYPNGHRLNVERNAPEDVLVVYNYLDKATCDRIARYADSQAFTDLTVVDPDKSTREKIVTQKDERRITNHVEIDGIAYDIINIFNDIYCNCLASFYDVNFEWYERPQILRYPPGGKYNQHADADHWQPDSNTWVRVQDRDYSVLLYLNQEYEGGEIQFVEQNYTLKPRTGMLLAFPSDHRFLHAALPTTSGIRYVIVSWSAVVGSKRVRPQLPFASVYIRQKRSA